MISCATLWNAGLSSVQIRSDTVGSICAGYCVGGVGAAVCTRQELLRVRMISFVLMALCLPNAAILMWAFCLRCGMEILEVLSEDGERHTQLTSVINSDIGGGMPRCASFQLLC